MSGSEAFDSRLGTGGAVETSAQLLERLADKLGVRACTATVFGDPIAERGVTVVPVARAGFGFGGGLGRESTADRVGEGGGGGGGMDVRPLGFIEIRDGVARYRPIRDSWTDVVVPLAAIATGLTAPRLLRAGMRLYRARRH
ncbi:spore germination protein GerW family protein [Nocardia puris]|uniref:spore germination protein GerW family protein n=1 Tax=Nocardia puris TaxID=208602 RepID=UPI002E1A4EB5